MNNLQICNKFNPISLLSFLKMSERQLFYCRNLSDNLKTLQNYPIIAFQFVSISWIIEIFIKFKPITLLPLLTLSEIVDLGKLLSDYPKALKNYPLHIAYLSFTILWIIQIYIKVNSITLLPLLKLSEIDTLCKILSNNKKNTQNKPINIANIR